MSKPKFTPGPWRSENTPGAGLHTLKMARASEQEWEECMAFTSELQDKVYGRGMEYIDDEKLGRWVREKMPNMMRVVFGYKVLLDNCCDPKADHLAFKTMFGAAPDLYESLAKIVREIRAYQSPECDDEGAIGAQELKAADAALAKAEGRNQ